MADSYPAINGTGLVTTGAAQTISGAKTFLAGSATSVPVTIQAASGQSGNLLELKDTAGTVLDFIDANGRLVLASPVVGAVKLVARGASGQTANLQEWQDNTGAIQTRVDSLGNVYSSRAFVIGSSLDAGYLGAQISVPIPLVGNKGIVVRGASGQTASLQEWQSNAGGVMTYIRPDGTMIMPVLNVGNFIVDTASGVQAAVSTTAAGNKALMIRGFSGQTANLFEIQNSAGTNLVSVESGGRLRFDANTFGNGGTGTKVGGIAVNIAGTVRYLWLYDNV